MTKEFATDSLLAMGSSATASVAYATANPEHNLYPILGQIIIPVITGILVPFLKEYLVLLLDRMKERKKGKK